MMTKEQIKQLIVQLKDMGCTISPKQRGESPAIYINDFNDDEVGRILLSKEEDDLYIADFANIDEDFRGFGKILFYIAMDRIYPAWLAFDLTGFSSDANRVHEGLEKCDYVETGTISGDDLDIQFEDDEYYTNAKFRFTFKDK